MINQLMALERNPAVRWGQQKKVTEAREQALKDILSRVKNLQTAAKDLKSVTTWADTQTVESNDTSKITATRTGGAAPGSNTLYVTRMASGDQQSFKYTPPPADTTFQISTISGNQTVNLAAGQSIEEAVGIINSDPDSKVYAVKVGDRLVLSSRETGEDAAFTVAPASLTDALSDTQQLRTPVDAEYYLNGDPTPKTSASNVVKDGIPGIEFTIKSLVPSSDPVMLNVSNPATDQTAVKDKIKKFVEQYNSTIDLIRTKLSEQKVKDPTTDADRAKGNLYNDTMLNGLMQRLRSTVGGAFATGDATKDTLAEIGITTGSATGAAASADALAGKLVIDDAKLTAALSTDPTTVRKLLGGVSGVEGVGTRLDSLLDGVVKTDGDFDSRIKSIDKEQKRFDDQIAALDKRIELRAARLRAQFAAMEAAISNSQTQSSWLAQQLR